MVDSDAVKRLLEGDIEPSEIEGDPSLYSMAERIYGREALEEMGVFAPEVETPEIQPDFGEISDDVSLPDFQPEISDSKTYDKPPKGKRRIFTLFVGVCGLFGTLLNMVVGSGAVLCSIGLADMKQICNDDYGQTKLVWTKGYSWDRLHEIETWVEPMTKPLAGDVFLLAIFATFVLVGLFWRKKSVHSSDMVPLGG